MKTITVLTTFLTVAPIAPVARGDETPRVADEAFLDALRAEVRLSHPRLEAARTREQAAATAALGVRLWDDPVAGFSTMAARPAMRREDGDIGFTVEQMLPRQNLYVARRAKALREVRVRAEITRAAATAVEADAASTALELALADEVLRLRTGEVGWIEQMAVNAREKLADPASNAGESFRLESELARERQALHEIASRRLGLSRSLNILLGRNVENPWPPLALPPAPAPLTESAPDWQRLARQNPELRTLHAAAEAAEAEVAVIEQERSPQLSLGADTSVYSGGSLRSGGVALKISLPWFNDRVYKTAIERAQLESAAAGRDAEAARRNVEEEAVSALTEAKTAAEQSTAYRREVIPAADQAAEAIEAAWISSQASLLDVLDARRSALGARLAERRFMAAHRAALENLRALIPPALP